MKMNLFIVVLLTALALPIVSLAHGGDMGDMMEAGDTRFDMMRTIEDRAVGDELHEEMENLMVKMMSGNMTETEMGRMVTLMETYPGVHGMMMGRFTGSNLTGIPFGGMMGFSGSFWAWTMMLGAVVWLIVGILAVVWLLRKLMKP